MAVTTPVTAYKLTDKNGCTRGNTQWSVGSKHTALGDPAQGLCSDGYIHWYSDPVLALFLSPLHGEYTTDGNAFRLWEGLAEGPAILDDKGLKGGSTSFTAVKEVDLADYPLPSDAQRIAFAILCAREIETDEAWNQWADKWLSGEDRSKEGAGKLKIGYLTDAAYKAVRASETIDAINRIRHATRAVYWAAESAFKSGTSVDLPAIAKKAMVGF